MAAAKCDNNLDSNSKLGKLLLGLLDVPQAWRERMLQIIFTVALILSLAPFINNLISAFSYGRNWHQLFFYCSVYAAMIFVLFWRTGPLASRARIGIFCIYSLGVLALVIFGPYGNGRPYLFAAALISALLLGPRFALWVLLLDIITLISTGILITQDFPLWTPIELWPWVASTASLLMLATTLIFSISALVYILEQSLARAKDSALDLQKIVKEQELTEKDLSHRLDLDAVVINLSHQLSNVQVENLDQTLYSILETIGTILHTSRAQLFEICTKQKTISVTHEWCSSDFQAHREYLQDIPYEWVPWLQEQLTNENHIAVVEPGEFAPEAHLISECLLAEQTHSSVSICLSYQNQCFGLLVLDATRYPKDWDVHDLSMIQTVASLIAARQNQILAEQALSQSEYKYRQLIESTPLAIFILDKNGYVIDRNASANQFQKPVDLKLSQGLLGYRPLIEEDIHTKFAQCIENFESATGEVDYLAESGNHMWVRYHLAPVAESSKNEGQVLLIVEDISETKHLQDGMYQYAKMEALGRLAGGVAHDFNNILTVINGYSEMLMLDMIDERARSDAQTIYEAGQRAVGLTRQLLMFSRRQPLELVSLDVNQVLDEMAKMLRRLVNEDIELEIDLSNEVGLIEADRGQIEQVIMNLVVNARDATPVGGHIRIATCMRDLDKSVNAIPQADNGSHVCIQVSDTGSGIEPEVMERLFEPFFTTKEKGHGTGLGLATVYGITTGAGGHIIVDSQLGKGTTFSVLFPEKSADLSYSAPKIQEKHRPLITGGNEHILVIEDDLSVKNLVLRMLNELGYITISASSGSEGLALLQDPDESVDLVISDVVMPGINGARLLNKVREIRSNLPVLLISGYPDGVIDEHGDFSTHERLLRKPITREKLAETVRKMLDLQEKAS